jgi:hypothetical protein
MRSMSNFAQRLSDKLIAQLRLSGSASESRLVAWCKGIRELIREDQKKELEQRFRRAGGRRCRLLEQEAAAAERGFMKPVRITPRADNAIDACFAWIAKENPALSGVIYENGKGERFNPATSKQPIDGLTSLRWS